MKRFLIWLGIGLVLLGCESMGGAGEGDVYAVNNVGSMGNLPFHGLGASLEDIYVIVVWEGERVKIHPNVDDDMNCTGFGAVKITSEPLAGDVVVDFVYGFFNGGNEEQRKLSDVLQEEVLVDGDITIELYSAKWDPTNHYVNVFAEVHRGKYDGIHMY